MEPLEARCLLSISALQMPPPHYPLAWHALPVAALVSPAKQDVRIAFGASGVKNAADDYGNTTGAAYPLTIGSTGSASASGKINYVGDVDMFSLVANGAGNMTVTIKAPTGKSGVVPQLVLYDGSGKVLSSNSGSSGNRTASASASVVSGGKYYIKAAGLNSTTGNYTVQVTVPIAPTPPPPPPPSPSPAPSLTPPSFLPGAAAYTAATAVTELIANTGGGQVLVILGTDAVDAITVSESGSMFSVTTAAGTQTLTGTFAGIAVYGFGGGDTIRLNNTIVQSLTTVLYAGMGDDTLFEAGPDTSYLYGQDGNDTLVSVGGGADVLYGGAGLDSFWFDYSDTLTDAEATETAAKSIHKITAFTQPTTDPAKAVSLEIAGQDIVDPTASYAYTNNFVNKPLWVDGPQYNDIAQGQVGDCYFLAGLSAMADTDPALLRQSITELGDGTYAVRFYKNGSEVYYRVDGQLPTSGSSPGYAKLSPSGELWVALEEKAFAQFRYGQNSYSSLSGGIMDEAYRALLGATYGSLSLSGSADTLAQNMANALAAGHAVTAGSSGASGPIVASHAYNVHAVTYESGVWYVTVYNPWGFDGASYDSNAGDGLLKLIASQFQSSFSMVEVCNA